MIFFRWDEKTNFIFSFMCTDVFNVIIPIISVFWIKKRQFFRRTTHNICPGLGYAKALKSLCHKLHIHIISQIDNVVLMTLIGGLWFYMVLRFYCRHSTYQLTNNRHPNYRQTKCQHPNYRQTKCWHSTYQMTKYQQTKYLQSKYWQTKCCHPKCTFRQNVDIQISDRQNMDF
jgi:hypothetical protein